jgi:predicted DNA-binding transcriptional regulator AlpA
MATVKVPAKPKRNPRAHLHARAPHEIAGSSPILLDEVGIERLTGISKHQLRALRGAGRGPNLVRVGRLVKYRLADVERWLSENTVSAADFKVAKRAAATPGNAGRPS